ncbi:universal stress protein [Kribbella sp. NPDC051952]|uniref:universal stress protein n=1 Tax=Kribbella sp. NPDC051952 TaxID=3154851 RepID=UPI003426C7E2
MRMFRGDHRAAAVPAPNTNLGSPAAGPDRGPVIVLVHAHGSDKDAVEWAAAEAAARGSALQIVYALQWPRLLDPLGMPATDLPAREAAEAVVSAAVHRAHRIAPSVPINGSLFPGRPIAALVDEARGTEGALVVLSHNRPGRNRKAARFERALARRLCRRTSASLAVIGLSAAGSVGPSAGRVVVGVDDDGGPPDAVGFAFRAARRRGTGLTVVHATGPIGHDDLEDTVRIWQMAYPEIDVRWRVAPGPVDSVVLAESAAAALTVLGRVRHGLIRQVLSGSSTYTILRLARGSVVLAAGQSTTTHHRRES